MLLARLPSALFRGDDNDGRCFTIASWEGKYQMLLWALAVCARVAGDWEVGRYQEQDL